MIHVIALVCESWPHWLDGTWWLVNL